MSEEEICSLRLHCFMAAVRVPAHRTCGGRGRSYGVTENACAGDGGGAESQKGKETELGRNGVGMECMGGTRAPQPASPMHSLHGGMEYEKPPNDLDLEIVWRVEQWSAWGGDTGTDPRPPSTYLDLQIV